MSAHAEFEARAAQWARRGRAASLLEKGYGLIALRCWIHSRGGKADGASSVLQEFVEACEAAQPEDWLDAYLGELESCSVCGESYRFENVSLCTHCSRLYCYRCAAERPRAANGNGACTCGGELVG